jgi:hypothetical protein
MWRGGGACTARGGVGKRRTPDNLALPYLDAYWDVPNQFPPSRRLRRHSKKKIAHRIS